MGKKRIIFLLYFQTKVFIVNTQMADFIQNKIHLVKFVFIFSLYLVQLFTSSILHVCTRVSLFFFCHVFVLFSFFFIFFVRYIIYIYNQCINYI